MAVDPNDLDKIEKAVNDGSGQVRALWFTFLGFETYLAVAAGSVTHRMLLEGSALKLPLLGVDLPIVGFFVIAPLSLLIFHFYLLLQMLTLARKVALYNELLTTQVAGHEDREKVRRRLDLFPLVQVLAGTSEDRSLFNAFLLHTVVIVTTVLWPVLVFLLMQLSFLPYHNAPVTWLHRLAIIADLAVIALLWPPLERPVWRLKILRDFDLSAWLVRACYAVVLFFSIVIASFPGEWIGTLAGPLPDLVLQGPINDATGRPVSPFSNVLVLTGEKFADDAKIAGLDKSISLRGRDLSGAIFVRADLRKADFTGANLTNAVFSAANLTEAHFGCAPKIDTKASEVGMYGASPPGLTEKENEPYGWPQDHCTWLAGASFMNADLRGADLSKARAQGANFGRARLEGANLSGADLTAGLFFGTRLNAALLDEATLYGAQFNSARLRGASLRGAHLDGAGVFQADFTAATLAEASVYATYAMPKPIKLVDGMGLGRDASPLGQLKYSAWLSKILARLPPTVDRVRITERLDPLNPDGELAKEKKTKQKQPGKPWDFAPPKPHREEAITSVLIAMGCNAEDAPYVAHGLIVNGRLAAAGKMLPMLASRLSNPKLCPGAVGLVEKDWTALAKLVVKRQAALTAHHSDSNR